MTANDSDKIDENLTHNSQTWKTLNILVEHHTHMENLQDVYEYKFRGFP